MKKKIITLMTVVIMIFNLIPLLISIRQAPFFAACRCCHALPDFFIGYFSLFIRCVEIAYFLFHFFLGIFSELSYHLSRIGYVWMKAKIVHTVFCRAIWGRTFFGIISVLIQNSTISCASPSGTSHRLFNSLYFIKFASF